jgi:hypothetical protein
MYPNSRKALTVYVQKLTVTDGLDEGMQVGQPFLATADSTRPYIYLPEDGYDQVLRYLNLVSDPLSGYVLVTEQQKRSLEARQTSLRFHLTEHSDTMQPPPPAVQVVLPTSSLIMQLGFPYVASTSWYLPIMKGNSSVSNFVLGRTFLQDAYLIADYDNRYFKIHQVDWNTTSSDPSKDFVLPLGSSPHIATPEPAAPSRNILIPVLVVSITVLFVVALSIFLVRRRANRKRLSAHGQEGSAHDSFHELPTPAAEETAEIDGNEMHEMPNSSRAELDGITSAIHEMDGSSSRAPPMVEYRAPPEVRSPSPLQPNQTHLSAENLRDDTVPASPIPQTPLEFYGDRIPAPRMNRALERLNAAETGNLPKDIIERVPKRFL